MIRVLHIVSVLHRGGVETMLMNFYRNIDRNIIQFDFIVHGSVVGEYEQEILDMGGRIYHVRTKRESFFGNAADITKVVADNHYSIVEVHQDAMSYFALKAAKKGGAKVRIAHAHSTSMPPSKLGSAVYPFAIKRTAKIATMKFSCSKASAQYLFNGDTGGTIYIYNSIDTEKFRFNRSLREEIRRANTLGDGFVLGQVGNFMYPKNQLFTIEVFRELLRSKPDSKLVFCGAGPDMDECKAKVKEYGIEASVLFTGNVPDVYKWLSAFDAMIMPSFYEGFPVATVEAQCAGLRTVVSDTITDEVCLTPLLCRCSLSAPKSGWAEKLLATCEKERTEFADIVASKGFDLHSVTEKLTEIYCSAVKDDK